MTRPEYVPAAGRVRWPRLTAVLLLLLAPVPAAVRGEEKDPAAFGDEQRKLAGLQYQLEVLERDLDRVEAAGSGQAAPR